MKKRNILLGGAFALLGLCALASCGKKEDDKKGDKTSTVETSTGETSTNITSTGETSTGVTSTAEEAKVLSYAEYMAAQDGDIVTIEAYIAARYTWWGDAASFYLRDDNGAYYAYNLPCTQDQYNNDLVVGQKISITGEKTSWSGEVEIAGKPSDGADNATWTKLNGSKTYEAVSVNSIADMANYPNQYVAITVEVVTPVEAGTATGAGVDLYYTVKNALGTDTTTYDFCVESYLENSQYSNETGSVYNEVLNLTAGDLVRLEGFVYTYANLPQLHTMKVTPVVLGEK